MSQESMRTLNTQTLIGFTDVRGTAWHYREALQGEEPNHYPGAIPVEDVLRRLFNWKAQEYTVEGIPLSVDADTMRHVEAARDASMRGDWSGVQDALDEIAAVEAQRINDQSRKSIIRPDTRAMLGVFRRGSYSIHDYEQWLIRNAEDILDGSGLGIGSALLIRGGRVAGVQYELPETKDAFGIKHRPFLGQATSLDGSLASTYQTGTQIWVCDNTMYAGLREQDAKRLKVYHSKNSLDRIEDVRAALEIVVAVEDDFSEKVDKLLHEPVTPQRFDSWVDLYVGMAKAKEMEGRALTFATEKAGKLITLWNSDERVQPWAGTAYGVLAAANTYEHHFAGVRGATRVDRNAERVVMGKVADMDHYALQLLARV
jgi:phage/plasmid-like protein (TIGR03299 family)